MSSLRDVLEEAIFANPDDLAAHAAYADHLAEEGDPRGEFIQVQLALEDPACTGERRRQLQQREQELLAAHESKWIGNLTSILTRKIRSHYRWRRGWLDELYLRDLDLSTAEPLQRCLAARIIRKLGLEMGWYRKAEDQDPLMNAPFLSRLRWFRLRAEVDFDEYPPSHRVISNDVVKLLERTLALDELHLLAFMVDLERLFALRSLTRLRCLILYHGSRIHPLEILAGNPSFAALETLRIHPDREPGNDSLLPREQVAALIRSPHLLGLRHLQLHASSLGDEGCAYIVASGILKRLKTLDLRLGCITDAGARVLAECPDICHLDQLSVGENEIGEEGIALLQDILGVKVSIERQYEPGSGAYLGNDDVYIGDDDME